MLVLQIACVIGLSFVDEFYFLDISWKETFRTSHTPQKWSSNWWVTLNVRIKFKINISGSKYFLKYIKQKYKNTSIRVSAKLFLAFIWFVLYLLDLTSNYSKKSLNWYVLEKMKWIKPKNGEKNCKLVQFIYRNEKSFIIRFYIKILFKTVSCCLQWRLPNTYVRVIFLLVSDEKSYGSMRAIEVFTLSSLSG